jgi:hypothetical protein
MREFAQYFDALFCLSLPESADRRRDMAERFEALGIVHYEFFDAVGPDHHEVRSLYEAGKVARYPPCFRCGELSCGRDDCNNVLVPAQVATCVSFQRLWRHILERDIGTALIVEDDVVFASYAPQVVAAVMQDGFLARTGIREDTPTLLRLGWKAGPDHQLAGTVAWAVDAMKMANHCFAVNRALCRELSDRFDRVETTADEYIHRVVGPTVRNFTLQPPIASDLSFSFGAVPSLIHPKKKRIAYLKQFHPERQDEIEATIEAVRTHVKHILYRPLLAIGHPRCGSRYTSELLRACGLDVGHEAMGKHGISSWMFAVEDDENPWARNPLARSRKNKHFGHVIHFVRNPRTAIPSIIREDRHAGKSFAFRRKHIAKTFGFDPGDARSDVDRAIASYIYWNKLVEAQNVDLMVRVEDAEESLLAFLKAHRIVAPDCVLTDAPPKNVNADKPYQGELHDKPSLSEEDWEGVALGLKVEINAMCERYGYPDLCRHA